MLSDVLKNGRMVSPEAVARRPMKAVKSMTVTPVPCSELDLRMFGHLPSPILQVAHGALSGSRVHPYQPLEPAAQRCIFFRLYRDHEFENAAVLARRQGLFMLAGIQAHEITAKNCPLRR